MWSLSKLKLEEAEAILTKRTKSLPIKWQAIEGSLGS
jgi:hypothetical protein